MRNNNFDPFTQKPYVPVDNRTPYKQGYKDGAIKGFTVASIAAIAIALFLSRRKRK